MKQTIVLVVLLLSIFTIHSQDILIIDGKQEEIKIIGKHLSYYQDKTNQLTIDDILEISDSFKKSNADVPNHGFSYSTYWYLCKINNNQEDFFINISWALFKDIEIFYVNDDDFITYSSSYINRDKIDEITSKDFVFKIPKGDFLVYIKTSTPFSIHLPIKIVKSNQFYHDEIIINILYGLFFGIILAILIYNLFLWISIKDNNYLIYVFYLASQFFFHLTNSGYYKIIFPFCPIKLFEVFFVVSVYGVMFFAIFFAYNFLEIKKYLNKLNKLYIILLIIHSFQFIILPFDVMIPIIVSDIIGVIGIPLLFFSSVYLFRKGHKQARFYAFAWFFVLSTGGLVMLKNLGFIIDNSITSYSIYFGTISELLLLSFAMGDKYNLMKKKQEESQKKALVLQTQMTNSFSRFVPREFLAYLNKEEVHHINLGDQTQKEMTILFSDIRDFTSLSEKMTPQENFNFINSYFKRVGPIIRKYNGFVDKYIGDAIMALFPDKVDNALMSAINMQEELNDYNKHRVSLNYQPIKTGIGLHTGHLMLGTIGEESRMDTSVISDSVNLASRLESLTKIYGSQIIISGQILTLLNNPEQYNYRCLDIVKVKGKKEPVYIFDILDGLEDQDRDIKIQTKTEFELAINLYQTKQIKESYDKFKNLSKILKDDVALHLYLERCKNMIEFGVPDGWDGITVMDTK